MHVVALRGEVHNAHEIGTGGKGVETHHRRADRARGNVKPEFFVRLLLQRVEPCGQIQGDWRKRRWVDAAGGRKFPLVRVDSGAMRSLGKQNMRLVVRCARVACEKDAGDTDLDDARSAGVGCHHLLIVGDSCGEALLLGVPRIEREDSAIEECRVVCAQLCPTMLRLGACGLIVGREDRQRQRVGLIDRDDEHLGEVIRQHDVTQGLGSLALSRIISMVCV